MLLPSTPVIPPRSTNIADSAIRGSPFYPASPIHVLPLLPHFADSAIRFPSPSLIQGFVSPLLTATSLLLPFADSPIRVATFYLASPIRAPPFYPPSTSLIRHVSFLSIPLLTPL